MSKRKAEQFRWQARDGEILEAIYQFEGLLSDEQIQQLFFRKALRTAQIRLQKLEQAGFVASLQDRQKRAQLSFRPYYLGKRGVAYIASLYREPVRGLKWRRVGTR